MKKERGLFFSDTFFFLGVIIGIAFLIFGVVLVMGEEESTNIVSVIGVIGEAGRVNVNQVNGSVWRQVLFQNFYDNPIVIMQPLSYNGGQPAHMRLRNVNSNGFEYQIEEWDYLDGKHGSEKADYFVIEAGRYLLQDGTIIEAGKVTSNHEFKRKDYDIAFAENPVILTQVQTYNEGQAIVTRNRKPNTAGFEIKVQEEERNQLPQNGNGTHEDEEVGYVAIQANRGINNGVLYEAFNTFNVTHNWKIISFANNYGNQSLFFASLTTYVEADSAGLRYRNLTNLGVRVKVEEEKSFDAEARHAGESVSYFVLGSPGVIVGTDVSNIYTCCVDGEFGECHPATIGQCRDNGGAVIECVPGEEANEGPPGHLVNYTQTNTTNPAPGSWVANLTRDVISTGVNNTEYVNRTFDCDDFANALERNLTALGYNATYTVYWCTRGATRSGHCVTDVHAPDGTLVFIEPQNNRIVNLDFDGDGVVETRNHHPAGIMNTDDDCAIEVYEDVAAATAAGAPRD